jgi:hypothetical protein
MYVIRKKTNYLLLFPNVFYKVIFLIRIIKFLLQRALKCKHYRLTSCKEYFSCLLFHMVSTNKTSTVWVRHYGYRFVPHVSTKKREMRKENINWETVSEGRPR